MNLILGDCIEELKKLPDNSVDSIVTDPPAGISFMGKEWDSNKGGRTSWIAWIQEVFEESKRVLKPGGHALVWALPRTSHWTATALEEAGYEIRDCVYHVFGSGFPKSLNIGKQKGCEEWEGWGTALKPAVECWWLARKPLSEKTVAENVLRWGTGGLNIDGSRVEYEEGGDAASNPLQRKQRGLKINHGSDKNSSSYSLKTNGGEMNINKLGRFPSHLIHDGSEEVVGMFPNTTTGGGDRNSSGKTELFTGFGDTGAERPFPRNEGSAARFFYCAKPSKAERDAGLDGFEEKPSYMVENGSKTASASNGVRYDRNTVQRNNHPTVKALALMRYLITLINPPQGTVLDMFMGSGSTGVAAKQLGVDFIGIEKEEEYYKIAKVRIENSKVQEKIL